MKLHLRRDEASLPAYLLLAAQKVPFERVEEAEGEVPWLEDGAHRIVGFGAIAKHLGAGDVPVDELAAVRRAYPYAVKAPLPAAQPSSEASRELAAFAPNGPPFTAADFALAPIAVRIRAYELPVSPRAARWVDAMLALPAFERWIRAS